MGIREQIKASAKIVPQAVDIPGLGEIYFLPLTTGEAIEIQREIQQAKDDGKWNEQARTFDGELLCRMICDESGALQYKRSEVGELLAIPLTVFRALSQHAMDISGLSSAAQEATARK